MALREFVLSEIVARIAGVLDGPDASLRATSWPHRSSA